MGRQRFGKYAHMQKTKRKKKTLASHVVSIKKKCFLLYWRELYQL